MEMSVALSILALFVAVFLSLSVRLARAQAQQEERSVALSILKAEFAHKAELPASEWVGPWDSSVKQNACTYKIKVEVDPLSSDLDRGFAVLRGSVSWISNTGPQTLSQEVWLHERLK